MTRVVLDISRLISRVRHARPSGVDRVEMAYARGLANRYGCDLAFCAVHPTGWYGRLRREVAEAYLDELERRWADPEGASGQRSLASVLPWMRRLLPTRKGMRTSDVLVQVSPHHLDRSELMRHILNAEQVRFVCMVHDLIPIEYPEYARPGGASQHEARMANVIELADAVITNSRSTATSLKRWSDASNRSCPSVHVALLGTAPVSRASEHGRTDDKPYFVCLGTIEPRKNHLLLLHLWRDMAQSLPADSIPRLMIIGRRGWENEQILDLLDRSSVLRPFMQEVSSCADSELAALIRGSKGLLMPSFAEGYGMPVAEALSAGIPVIASDIAAHREVGQSAPDYLDPLDGIAWKKSILDYANDGPLRRAQLDRLCQWVAPDWESHMDIASKVIDDIWRQ